LGSFAEAGIRLGSGDAREPLHAQHLAAHAGPSPSAIEVRSGARTSFARCGGGIWASGAGRNPPPAHPAVSGAMSRRWRSPGRGSRTTRAGRPSSSATR
jgi:hypothetical protein